MLEGKKEFDKDSLGFRYFDLEVLRRYQNKAVQLDM